MRPDQASAELCAAYPAARLDEAQAEVLAARLAVTVDPARRDDLRRAFAAVGGDPVALRELEASALGPASRAVRARGLDAADVDDVMQALRAHLLVGPAPALVTYGGRGSLAGFVRTAALRLALRVATRRAPERPGGQPGDDVLALLDDGQADAELALMRRRYAGALAGALTRAWAGLPPHDRFVLDLELRQRLGVDEIARVYDVQRGTALRRLASARAALVAGTRAALRAELRVGEATLDSVLRVVSTSARWAALPGVT